MDEKLKLAANDTCPTCRNAKLKLDEGESQSREEPSSHACVFCVCGDEFEVDWPRQFLYERTVQFVEKLFTSGFDTRAADRLVQRVNHLERDLGGWSRAAIIDRMMEFLDMVALRSDEVHRLIEVNSELVQHLEQSEADFPSFSETQQFCTTLRAKLFMQMEDHDAVQTDAP